MLILIVVIAGVLLIGLESLSPTSQKQTPPPITSPISVGPFAFSNYVILGKDNPEARGGEPSLNVGKSGTLWSTNVGSPGSIWKSSDKGKTWQFIQPPIGIGSADMDAAEDDAGRLHVADQTNGSSDCIFYYRSSDGGKTFDIVRGTHGRGVWFNGQGDCKGFLPSAFGVDKPWVATWGRDTVYIVYREFGQSGVDYSYDAGKTFSHVITALEASGIAVDPLDGSLYLIYEYGGEYDPALGAMVEHKIGVASSLDRGKTFSESVVIDRGSANVHVGGFQSLAVDRAHNVYAVWGDDSSGRVEIYLSVSKDRGKTWGAPRRVSSGHGASIWPTIVAGDAGRIAIAWYGTPDPVQSPTNAPHTKWYVYAAVSTDALDENPVFEEVKVHPEPFHRNSICFHVDICEGVDITTGRQPPGYEGGIADFFRIALDAEGLLNVIWTDTAHYNDSPKDHFARQISGTRLLTIKEASRISIFTKDSVNSPDQ